MDLIVEANKIYKQAKEGIRSVCINAGTFPSWIMFGVLEYIIILINTMIKEGTY